MHEPRAELFYETELTPLLAETMGPVESFTLTEAADRALKDQAVAMGEIPSGAFANLAIFDNSANSLTQKQHRYAAKTGSGVLRVLVEGDLEHGTTSPRARAIEMAAVLHVRQEVNHAVVVEAASKLHGEAAAAEPNPRHVAIYKQELDRAQSELYPEPSEVIARSILGQLGDHLRAIDPIDLPEDQRDFLSSFRTQYPAVMERHAAAKAPELPQERVAEFKAALRERFEPAMQKVRDEIGGELTQKDMARAMNIFMRDAGMPMAEHENDHRGWLCVEDTSFAGYKTIPAKRRMYAGRFSNPSWHRFEELAIHEAIVHAMRSENGASSGVEAMRVGLTGNASFEEGLGLVAEQLWGGEIKKNLGRDDFRYIAIAYAEGLVDGERHNETETLRFTSSFMMAVDIAKGTAADAGELLKKKRGLAYDHVKRAFRGMPEGSVLHSNLSYLQGKLDAIRFISGLSAPADEVLDYLLQGKFNPLNKEHRQVLEALDMTAKVT